MTTNQTTWKKQINSQKHLFFQNRTGTEQKKNFFGIENVNRPITSNEIEAVIKTKQNRKLVTVSR